MSMLNVSKLREYDLLLPSNEALTAFRNISIDMLERVAENERETRTLAQTRDLLLPRLMSGELRVADVDQAQKEPAA